MESSMEAQEITWGWTIRLFLGVLWRWAAATIVATFALALIVVIVGRIIHQPGLRHDPVFPKILIVIWLLLFFWAFKTALASLLERFDVSPVLSVDRQSIERRTEPVRMASQAEWRVRVFVVASWCLAILPIVFYIFPIAVIPWVLLTVFALFKFPDHRRLFLYSAPLAILPPLLMFLFIWACARNHSCP